MSEEPLDLDLPVAVFPLPGVVFFPHTALPLNIFEPRYREMVEWCIEQGRPIAVALITPGNERDQLGDPPFETVAGLGEIVHHEKLPDGRYQLLLHGTGRVHLTERDRDASFRKASAAFVPDRLPGNPSELSAQVESLEALAVGLNQPWPQGSNMISRLLNQTRDPATLSNCLSSALWTEPADRQRMLACANVEERMQQVVDRLARVLVDVSDGGPAH